MFQKLKLKIIKKTTKKHKNHGTSQDAYALIMLNKLSTTSICKTN